MRQTRLGLKLIFYGICLSVVAWTVYVLLAIAFQMTDGTIGIDTQPKELAGSWRLRFRFALFAGTLMILAGEFLCLYVPSSEAGRGMIQSSIGLQVLAFCALLALYLIAAEVAPSDLESPNAKRTQIDTSSAKTAGIAVLVTAVVGIASIIAAPFYFIGFLNRLTSFIGRYDLQSYSAQVANALIIAIVICIALVAAVFLLARGAKEPGRASRQERDPGNRRNRLRIPVRVVGCDCETGLPGARNIQGDRRSVKLPCV